MTQTQLAIPGILDHAVPNVARANRRPTFAAPSHETRQPMLFDPPDIEIPVVEDGAFHEGRKLGSGCDRVAFEVVGQPDLVIKRPYYYADIEQCSQCRKELSAWRRYGQRRKGRGFAPIVAVFSDGSGYVQRRAAYVVDQLRARRLGPVGDFDRDELIRTVDDYRRSACLSDAHGGNLGVTPDGRPVVIDYGFVR